MTREEAIEVVKSNWPPAHYTMLAEALTVLITHDEAIRRECADRAWEWFCGKSKEDNFPAKKEALTAAILATEPAREES